MFKTGRVLKAIEGLGLEPQVMSSNEWRIWDPAELETRHYISGFLVKKRRSSDILAYTGQNLKTREELRQIARKYGLSYRCVTGVSDRKIMFEIDGEPFEKESDGVTYINHLLDET